MNPKRLSTTPKEHEQIFRYIKDKDPSAAADVIKIHIRKAKENILLIHKREEEKVYF
jgi:DNA-binding GntR family transcriptional regulator